ncbi:hypothetical protein [Kineothrix sp. MSJ-39]|uniref:hypothetical protein n=1 Tax=Kineothrix sp. MSJ-39 TaxID=2841533 RepID=UPI0020A0002D|nr:hypothetical protein [Kineothrix sp. MSJ-39]
MILVFAACGLYNKSAFVGNEIADTDFYDVEFEQMNSTHSHNIDMDVGESIKVKIIRKSGKISVQIYNEDDQSVYKGDDVTIALDFYGPIFGFIVYMMGQMTRAG